MNLVWDVYVCRCACMYAYFYVFYGLDHQAKYVLLEVKVTAKP